MDELVERLSVGEHPVELSVRPERTPRGVKEQIDRGHVHIMFTATRGGTELSVQLDRDASDVTQADFEAGTGPLRLVGDLTLNYVNVRCMADIDLGTYAGKGRLQPVADTELHATPASGMVAAP